VRGREAFRRNSTSRRDEFVGDDPVVRVDAFGVVVGAEDFGQ